MTAHLYPQQLDGTSGLIKLEILISDKLFDWSQPSRVKIMRGERSRAPAPVVLDPYRQQKEHWASFVSPPVERVGHQHVELIDESWTNSTRSPIRDPAIYQQVDYIMLWRI